MANMTTNTLLHDLDRRKRGGVEPSSYSMLPLPPNQPYNYLKSCPPTLLRKQKSIHEESTNFSSRQDGNLSDDTICPYTITPQKLPNRRRSYTPTDSIGLSTFTSGPRNIYDMQSRTLPKNINMMPPMIPESSVTTDGTYDSWWSSSEPVSLTSQKQMDEKSHPPLPHQQPMFQTPSSVYSPSHISKPHCLCSDDDWTRHSAFTFPRRLPAKQTRSDSKGKKAGTMKLPTPPRVRFISDDRNQGSKKRNGLDLKSNGDASHYELSSPKERSSASPASLTATRVENFCTKNKNYCTQKKPLFCLLFLLLIVLFVGTFTVVLYFLVNGSNGLPKDRDTVSYGKYALLKQTLDRMAQDQARTCKTAACVATAGDILSKMNLTADPCDGTYIVLF